MGRATEPLPYEQPPSDPADPGYESHRAMLRESQRNWEYFVAHEAQIFEHHLDDIAIVYSGGKVQYCADSESVVEFLETLDDVQRPAAHLCTPLSSDLAWAL